MKLYIGPVDGCGKTYELLQEGQLLKRRGVDVEAILARNPDVLLVDGLAHRNRPEARRATRLDDIRCLLAHGISIITTVNVYELDGANEEAQALPGFAAPPYSSAIRWPCCGSLRCG